VIQEQEAALRNLSAPILQVWSKVLAVPIMGGLDHRITQALRERLLGAIAAGDTEHVILDLTAVDWVDTGTANHLIRLARAVELLGASVIITGIRASVSDTFVTLGIDLGGLRTMRNLQEGIRACMTGVAEDHARPARGRGSRLSEENDS
jgi:rsbT co-antagonist protein RsbR